MLEVLHIDDWSDRHTLVSARDGTFHQRDLILLVVVSEQAEIIREEGERDDELMLCGVSALRVRLQMQGYEQVVVAHAQRARHVLVADDVSHLVLVDVTRQLVRHPVVAVGTNGAVQVQRLAVEGEQVRLLNQLQDVVGPGKLQNIL